MIQNLRLHITEALSTSWAALLDWFGRRQADPVPPPAEEPTPEPIDQIIEEKVETAPTPAPRFERASFGALYYLDDLLGQLDRYATVLNRLKRYDRDTYDAYRRIGARLISKRTMFSENELASAWHDPAHRPALGMVYFGFNEEESKGLPLQLAYFTKHKFVKHVQVFSGDIYEIVMFWCDPVDRQMTTNTIFHLGIDSAGTEHILRHHTRRYRQLPGKAQEFVPATNWKVPDRLQSLADSYERATGVKITPEAAALKFFHVLANTTVHAASGIQVRARKNGVTATFDIDMLRTPYFFKNREKTITENGVTKRIFHIARAHQRTLPSGKTIFVKTHFRGHRKFTWNGFAVTISMPGLHHNILHDLDAAAVSEDEIKTERGKLISTKAMAKLIDKHMEQG